MMEEDGSNRAPPSSNTTTCDGGGLCCTIDCCSLDSFFHDLSFDDDDDDGTTAAAAAKRSNVGCSHFHTCNNPHDDDQHTHSCLHIHTTTTISFGKRPETPTSTTCGNREGVRRYGEKKEEEAVSLECENRLLREQNRLLLIGVHSLSAVEAENARLKCLLVDLLARIDAAAAIGAHQQKQQQEQEEDMLMLN